jgi:hypothetical protein
MEKEDIDDIDFDEVDRVVEEKRHNELKASLGRIATAISSQDDKQVVDAINKQGEQIGKLVKAISEIPKEEKSEAPEINVELNPIEFVSSAKQICKDIIESNNKVIEALENRMLPDTFTLIKNYGGVTDSVKVNYKTAKEIKNKK